MRSGTLLLSIAFCAAVGLQIASAAAPETPEAIAVRLRDKAMNGESIAYPFVSELTTRFGPRPAGSSAEQHAAAWAAARLTALGFENVRIESFPIQAWVRGSDRGEIVSPNAQPLAVAALGQSPATPPGGLEGEVVIFSTLDDLLAAPKGSLAGKIAMVARRMVRVEDLAGYAAVVPARAAGPHEAAQRGAIAFIMRSAGPDHHRMPHAGTTRYFDGRVDVPAFALSAPDADQIERLAALGEKVRVRLFSTASYVKDAHSQNVVADVRGRERPDEIVMLGAHLDSWDLGTGAIDDAAGDAIMAGAAKLIAELPRRPKRTIRVVFFGSEEVAQPVKPFGAFGGNVYATAHTGELAKHVLAGESDLGADRILSVTLPKSVADSDFAKSVYRVLTPIGVLASQTLADPGTDVSPSVEAGVPAVGLAQDASGYFDLHHTADDTLDKIDRRQLDQNVAAWAVVAWLAAESDVDFRGGH